MKPEIKFATIILIILVGLFIFANSIGPKISANIDKYILGEGYKILEDEKFRIFYPEDEYTEYRIEYEIKLLNDFINKFSADMKEQDVNLPEWTRKCTIYILKNHNHLKDVSLAKDLVDMENNGGYFNPAMNSIALIKLDRKGLYHELTHLLLHSAKFQNVDIKPWLDEAFAQYYETTQRPPDLKQVENLHKIEEIIRFNRQNFSGADNSRFYASSLYFLVFLFEEKQEQSSVFKALKSELRSGTSALDAELERKFGLAKLNEEFANWYQNLK